MSLKNELPQSFSFSQTSLQDYLACPLLFQLKYIERLPWPAAESEPMLENERLIQAGALFHRMVQQHLVGLPAAALSCPQDFPDLTRWWSNYLAEPAFKDLLSRNVEIILSVPVGNYRLLAKYDLVIVQPDGKAIIYDWKTSRKRPRDETMHSRVQTRLYRCLLARAGADLNGGRSIEPSAITMTYWYPAFPHEPITFTYSAEQYEADWRSLSGLVEEIASCREFPMSETDRRCPFCTYRSYCDRGEKAGSMEEQEAAENLNAIDIDAISPIEF